MIRKYRHLSGKNKISKFPQVGKMSTDSNIILSHVCNFSAVRISQEIHGTNPQSAVTDRLRRPVQSVEKQGAGAFRRLAEFVLGAHLKQITRGASAKRDLTTLGHLPPPPMLVFIKNLALYYRPAKVQK